jgi:hypothetical protein
MKDCGNTDDIGVVSFIDSDPTLVVVVSGGSRSGGGCSSDSGSGSSKKRMRKCHETSLR